MISDKHIIVFKPTNPWTAKKSISLFLFIPLLGLILFLLPTRIGTSHATNYTVNLIFSIVVTVTLLIVFILKEYTDTLTIYTNENRIETLKCNVFMQKKIITQQLDKIVVEYFSDNTRTGPNQILVLKDKNKVVQVDSRQDFPVDKLEEIKKIVESYNK